VADQLRPKVPKLATLMDETDSGVLARRRFPKDYQPQRPSTKPLERRNGQVKRRPELVGISQRAGHHSPGLATP
jgi:putative transposase